MSNIKPVSHANTVILACHEKGPRLVKIEKKIYILLGRRVTNAERKKGQVKRSWLQSAGAVTPKVRPSPPDARRCRWCWRTAPLISARSRLLPEPGSRYCGFLSSAWSPSQLLGNCVRSYNTWQRVGVIRSRRWELDRTWLCNQLNFRREP